MPTRLDTLAGSLAWRNRAAKPGKRFPQAAAATACANLIFELAKGFALDIRVGEQLS